ncbi:beta-ketoacyl synthase N-terminal-like domain-containing protein, partial [Klebsiella pneumoniae]
MAENDFGIAIIGMAGRFPQADTVQAFWENLLASRECISFYSDEELLAMGISPEFV